VAGGGAQEGLALADAGMLQANLGLGRLKHHVVRLSIPCTFSDAVIRRWHSRNTSSARGSVSEYQSDRGIMLMV
jgi:hypothetical protein